MQGEKQVKVVPPETLTLPQLQELLDKQRMLAKQWVASLVSVAVFWGCNCWDAMFSRLGWNTFF